MQIRRINEATIGLLALGKSAELGRQLTLVANSKYAEQMGQKLGVKPQTLQEWGNGYVAFDAVIAVSGVLAMVQGMRKNRKGAGQAALVQGLTTIIYSIYYLFYSLIGLGEAKGNQKAVNVVASLLHGAAGVIIYRFAQKALK